MKVLLDKPARDEDGFQDDNNGARCSYVSHEGKSCVKVLLKNLEE